MRTMLKATTAVAATVAMGAVALLGATPASAALAKKSFGISVDLGARSTLPSDRSDGVGAYSVTVGSGAVNGGKATVVIVDRVVAPGGKNDSEVRDNQVTLILKDGTVVAEAVDEDPKGGKPESLHILPVVGGTGAYASARGTVLMRPVGGKYLLAYDFFVEKKTRSKSFTFAEPVSARAASDGPRGLGSVTLTRAEQGTSSYIAVSTSLGGAKKAPKQAVELTVFDGESTLFARGMSTTLPGAGKALTLAVLGGTGTYSGQRGELTLAADGTSIVAKLAAPGGSEKSLTWTNKSKASYDDSTALGSAVYDNGSTAVAKTRSRAKTTPVYFSSQIAYPEVGGVVPVITMIEQTLATGTMLITGMTLQGSDLTLPIIGGTGDYGGAMGEAVTTPVRTGQTKAVGSFRR